jgi:hypothetical protein
MITSAEFTAALDAVRAGLSTLADLDAHRMPRQTDLAYQQLCSIGAALASAVGDEVLVERLSVAVVTCHSCPV